MTTSKPYTLGAWKVDDGDQQAFIDAWKDLGEVFRELADPPGRGTLLQSVTDPTRFYSFGPWESMEAIEAMRRDDRAVEGLERLMSLCSEASPGAYQVVATSE